MKKAQWSAGRAVDYLPNGKVRCYGLIKRNGKIIGHIGPGKPVGTHRLCGEFKLASEIVELLNGREVFFAKYGKERWPK